MGLTDIKKFRAGRRRKLRNFGSKAHLNGLISRKKEITIADISPLFLGKFNVIGKDGISSLIVRNYTFCDAMKDLGRCRLKSADSSMNHKSCMCAGLSVFGSQKSNSSD